MSAVATAPWALQAAVYDRLSQDVDLGQLIGAPPRLFDVAPTKPVYPFVVFADWKTTPLVGADDGLAHEFRLRCYSRYEGRLESRAVMTAIYDALQDANLSVDGHDLVSLRFIFSDVFLSPDGQTWNGVMRFRAVTCSRP
ncbi:MAG: DUF3168 domain-containing protein [Pseudomonadota bacterium]